MRARMLAVISGVTAIVVLGGGPAFAADQGVDVQDNSFVPPTVTIAPGDSVTWTQSGSNPHSVTADDDSFDSHPNCPPVCMDSGDEFSHTFDEPGEYGYFCKIHGSPGQGMSGTVVVQAAGGQAEDDPQDEPDDSGDDPDDAGDDADEAAEDAADTTDDRAGEDDAAIAEDDAAAADDAQQLPHTGGGALAVVGVLVFAAGVFAFRRRGKD